MIGRAGRVLHAVAVAVGAGVVVGIGMSAALYVVLVVLGW